MNTTDWIAVGSLFVNMLVLFVNGSINNKVSQLKLDIYEKFLTKKDYYDFQRSRGARDNYRRS